MNDNQLQFESLPNEILNGIFEYFEAKDLFRYFYNLNSRLNICIESLNNLHLVLTSSYCLDNHRYSYITPYIDFLIVSNKVQTNLNYFPKIRRLILLQPTDQLLKQFETDNLPCLEHLFIRVPDHVDDDRMSHLWNKIFSNGFSNLKSCCIYKMNFIPQSPYLTQVLLLRILKIGDVDLTVYKSILSSCPNLHFLKFTRIISNDKPTDIIRHTNLKKLIVMIPWFEELSNDCDMNIYFSYIPNLEQFVVHRTVESKYLNKSFLKVDWYASLITLYLPLLTRFTCYFHILKSVRLIDSNMQNILHEIDEHFNHVHHRLYQHRFIIDLIG